MTREDESAVAADVARALLERAERDAAGDRAEREAEPASAAPPSAAPPRSVPLPIDERATRHHIEALTALVQALTLRGRALARQNAEVARASTPAPEGSAEERLSAAAIRAHELLVEHPIAARALVSALAAEGRRFAQTEEGAALRQRLLRSRLVRRGALLWSSLTMGLIDETEPTALPSSYVDALSELGQRDDLEQVLGAIRERTGA